MQKKSTNVNLISNCLQTLNTRANDITYKNIVISINLMYDIVEKICFLKFLTNRLIDTKYKKFDCKVILTIVSKTFVE